MAIICGHDKIIELLNGIDSLNNFSKETISEIYESLDCLIQKGVKPVNKSGDIYFEKDINNFFKNNVFCENGKFTVFVTENQDTIMHCVEEDENGNTFASHYMVEPSLFVGDGEYKFNAFYKRYSNNKSVKRFNKSGKCNLEELENTHILSWPELFDEKTHVDTFTKEQ